MIPYNENFHKDRTGPALAADYKEAPGRFVGDDDDWVVWSARIDRDVCEQGLTYEQSLAKHRLEWRTALGLTAAPPGPTPGPIGPLPPIPSRDQLLRGQCTLQGLVITIDGVQWPWWGACGAWLTPDQRRQALPQLIAAGEKILIIEYPDGRPLYNEGGQFYSPDKFPSLLMNMRDFAALVAESLAYRGPNGEHFDGCWIFLGGDDGNNGGYFESAGQMREMGPTFAAWPGGDLNQYCVPLPGWDGVWHKPDHIGTGYTPQQIRDFSLLAFSVGAREVGIEGGVGYLLCGEGGGDYVPGGAMSAYGLVLSEYNDDQFDVDDVWQILGRYLGPEYIRPTSQPAADDPNPPFILEPLNEHGEHYVHRVFEFRLYGTVRESDVVAGSEHTKQNRRRFESMGARTVC